MLVEMKVEGLLFDPRSNMYILLLKELEGTGTLPIWIGKPEADSIALALGKVATPRPLTHDLVKNLIDGLKMRITKIVVTEIIDNTYYAMLHVTDGRKDTLVDSRPSDAVAISLRVNAPIFVEESILSTKTADELDEWLKNLRPEDFGNIM
jgi:uncharacterized protein